MNGSDVFSRALTRPRLFVAARNAHVVPNERRIERLPSGYSVLERCDPEEGSYWLVVTALEVA